MLNLNSLKETYGVSVYKGEVLRPDLASLSDLSVLFSLTRDVPVVMVHGFRYDPTALNDNNPHISTFEHWRRDIFPARSAFGFGWWSCPGGASLFRSAFSSWRSGRWNTYRYAWDLAEEAGQTLANILANAGRPTDIICHSLGSRVVLQALLEDNALPVRRVVLMNGAELSKTARAVGRQNPHVRFINLAVQGDDVLSKFGALFAPNDIYSSTVGQVGVKTSLRNWRDVYLDTESAQTWAKSLGWPDVQGDNPDGILDHWYSHKHPGNWGLIRGALDGAI